jgi:hypothetical protein
MSSSTYIIIGVLLIIVPFTSIYLLKRFEFSKRQHGNFAERFFETSTKLINDDRLDPVITETLLAFSKVIDDPKFVRHLTFMWVRGDIGLDGHSPNTSRYRKAVDSMSTEQRNHFIAAVALAVFGATYAAPVFGVILRRLLLRPIGMPNRYDDAEMFVPALPMAA